MTFPQLLQRCRQLAALWSRAPAKYTATIYIDGPLTKWNRSAVNWQYEEHEGGVRIPLHSEAGVMPEPDELEIVQRRKFRTMLGARIWIVARLNGFDHSKIVGEIR